MTTSERILRDKSEDMGLEQAFLENKEEVIADFHRAVIDTALNGGISGKSGLEAIAQNTLENHFNR